MQLLCDASSALSAEECARELLDSVPQVMATIRKHMREHRSGLTVPQFRTLCYVSTSEGCSLSAVADFIGLSLAAMSRLVEGLVADKLMERKPGEDRRHVHLSLTPAGRKTITEARQIAQTQLAQALSGMTVEQRSAFGTAMQVLKAVFSPEPWPGGDASSVEAKAMKGTR